MGIDVADVSLDGHDDILIVDMLSRHHRGRATQSHLMRAPSEPVAEAFERAQFKRNVLQLNRGDGTFAEVAHFCGLEASEWSWTLLFLDVDLDGYDEVLIPTGHHFNTQDSDVQERLKAMESMPPAKRLLQYPRLPLSMMAFRNLGNLR